MPASRVLVVRKDTVIQPIDVGEPAYLIGKD